MSGPSTTDMQVCAPGERVQIVVPSNRMPCDLISILKEQPQEVCDSFPDLLQPIKANGIRRRFVLKENASPNLDVRPQLYSANGAVELREDDPALTPRVGQNYLYYPRGCSFRFKKTGNPLVYMITIMQWDTSARKIIFSRRSGPSGEQTTRSGDFAELVFLIQGEQQP